MNLLILIPNQLEKHQIEILEKKVDEIKKADWDIEVPSTKVKGREWLKSKVSRAFVNNQVIYLIKDNSIVKLNVLSPFKGFTFSNNLTYQIFNKGQDFEYINADNIEKTNYDSELKIKKGIHTLLLSNYFFKQEDEGSSRLSNASWITGFSNTNFAALAFKTLSSTVALSREPFFFFLGIMTELVVFLRPYSLDSFHQET